jgi:hypothetical protein
MVAPEQRLALTRVTSARHCRSQEHRHRAAGLWVPAKRPPRPIKGLIVLPRLPSPLSLFRSTRRSARQPSRLTLAAAAATVVATAGITAGVAASATGPVSAVSDPAAVSHASAVRAPGHARIAIPRPASGQAAPRTARAHRPHHPPARVRPASGERHRKKAAGQHRARTQHHATARGRVTQHPGRQGHPAAPARHARPYLIYDSTTPSAIPADHVVATYATGKYAVSPSQVTGQKRVLWIDVFGMDHAASILDVEPGDATPSLAASWAWHRLRAQPKALARIYTMRSEWPAVQAAVATLPARMRSRIRWWIADPTGYPHIVPGSDATQWHWGRRYDISTATPRF